jgi:hypothetical protein
LVLKGAEHYLKTDCIGIQLEAFTLPMLKEAKLFPELVNYLKQFGFYLSKQLIPHGSFDSQCECIFLKEDISWPEIEIIKKVYGL